jgi:4-hydroxy-tetrahydrodipicolinate synthase
MIYRGPTPIEVMMMEIRGCGTAMITPFNSDGSLDLSALRAFVDWQIREGIHFLVPCGTTGESVTLAHDEYLEVVRTTVEVARGRVPVIAGAGGNNTAKIIELIAELGQLGVDGILSVSPYYNKPTQEGIYQHFRAIAASTRLPIIVYNVPGRTSSNILPDTLLRLAEIDNILGVKEASGDISQIGEICTRAPQKFRILSGDDSLTLPLVALGGHGIISVASNEAPGIMSRFAAACLDGKWDEARELNRRLYPLMKVNFVETSPIPVKAGVAMMGHIKEVYRLPLVPISDGGREKLVRVMKNLGLI